MGLFKNTTIEGDFRSTDDILDLNSELIGTSTVPTFTRAGLRIARGSRTDAMVAFDESEAIWKVGTDPDDGGILQRIVTEDDIELFLGEGNNIEIFKNSSTGEATISAVPTGSGGEIQFASVNPSTGESFFDSSPDIVFDNNALIVDGEINVADLFLSEIPELGSTTSQVLIRNPSNGRIEYIDGSSLEGEDISIIGNGIIDITYSDSLGQYEISSTAPGNTGEIIFNETGDFGRNENLTYANGALTVQKQTGQGTDPVLEIKDDSGTTSMTYSVGGSFPFASPLHTLALNQSSIIASSPDYAAGRGRLDFVPTVGRDAQYVVQEETLIGNDVINLQVSGTAIDEGWIESWDNNPLTLASGGSGNASSNKIKFAVNREYKGTINSNGFLGLNTTSPEAIIEGFAFPGQTESLLRLNDDTGSPIFEDRLSGDRRYFEPGAGVILTTPDGSKQFRIRIDNNGTIVAEEITP